MAKKNKNERGEGNLYDKIFKENIVPLFLPLLDEFLGIKILKTEVLDAKLQKTIEREVDFARIVTTKNCGRFILHLEFQVTNDSSMVYRFNTYNSLLVEKYRLPIKHVLIYLGSPKMTMIQKLPKELVFTGYTSIIFNEIDFRRLLEFDAPEAILLALLGDGKGRSGEDRIMEILASLKQLDLPIAELKKYTSQLQVLSQLRNLDEDIDKIIETMPVLLDITKNAGFKRHFEAAENRGIEKATLKVVINMLTLGKLTLREIAKCAGISLQKVKQIAKQLEDNKK